MPRKQNVVASINAVLYIYSLTSASAAYGIMSLFVVAPAAPWRLGIASTLVQVGA
jgi:hypothetical protein